MLFPQQINQINPNSNISIVTPTVLHSSRGESGLIGGDLLSSVTQPQMTILAPGTASLTATNFPLTSMNLGILPSAALTVSLTRPGVPTMDPEALSQLQAPGQPYIGAHPEA